MLQCSNLLSKLGNGQIYKKKNRVNLLIFSKLIIKLVLSKEIIQICRFQKLQLLGTFPIIMEDEGYPYNF